ncbi:MAG: hypothetical protein K2X52_16840 [Mycobacteriaceae bacterium]|nr:hypothetical protein [Mycobacteriaceae bacterium]
MRKPFHCGAVAVLSAAAVALTAYAPAAGADPYTPAQTQDSAEFAIADGYIAMQAVCTPDVSPVFESVTWDAPRFTPEGGTGMIHDANPDLGGHFAATWSGENWAVEYQFC